MLKFDYKNLPFKDSHRLANPARTLPADIVGSQRSGWCVKASVVEDHFLWVSYFEAFHFEYGLVFGDFEDVVYASSKKALQEFLKAHPFEEWDYWDI